MSADWRLLTYSTPGSEERRPGLLVDGRIVDLGRGSELDAASTLEILEQWREVRPRLDHLATTVSSEHPLLADVVLRAPIDRPSAIFCAVSNYGDHVSEMSGRKLVDKSTTVGPYLFLKTPHSITDPEAIVSPAAGSEQLDWEVELGVVIGVGGRNIAPEDVYDHIAGYVVLNELSARDLGRPEAFKAFGIDVLSSKSFDSSLPIGPWITPHDAVGDPMDLALKLTVGDEVMQDSSTSWMHYDVVEQVSFLSRSLTLRPGDLIATGTPSGVGLPRGRFLQDGEIVVAEIEKLGWLRNEVRHV